MKQESSKHVASSVYQLHYCAVFIKKNLRKSKNPKSTNKSRDANLGKSKYGRQGLQKREEFWQPKECVISVKRTPRYMHVMCNSTELRQTLHQAELYTAI